MKKTICTLALSGFLGLGVTIGAFAQDMQSNPPPPQGAMSTGHHQMDPAHELAKMTKSLKLTQDQQTQVQPILADRDQQLNALWMDKTTPRKERMAKSQQIRDDASGKIEAVLNDMQKQKYQTMQASMHQKQQVESTPGAQDSQPQ
jgi:protein CpxP